MTIKGKLATTLCTVALGVGVTTTYGACSTRAVQASTVSYSSNAPPRTTATQDALYSETLTKGKKKRDKTFSFFGTLANLRIFEHTNTSKETTLCVVGSSYVSAGRTKGKIKGYFKDIVKRYNLNTNDAKEARDFIFSKAGSKIRVDICYTLDTKKGALYVAQRGNPPRLKGDAQISPDVALAVIHYADDELLDKKAHKTVLKPYYHLVDNGNGMEFLRKK